MNSGAQNKTASGNAVEPRPVIPVVCGGHSRPVTHVSFSGLKSGEYYSVSCSKDCEPIMRDGKTGDWIGTYIGHQGACWCARFSNDGKRTASGAADFTARVWEAGTGEILYKLNHDHIVRAVDFCPSSNKLILTATQSGYLRLWSLPHVGRPAAEGPSKMVEGTCMNDTDKTKTTNNNSNKNYFITIGDQQPKGIRYAVWIGGQIPTSSHDVNKQILSGTIVTAQTKTVKWWRLQATMPSDDQDAAWTAEDAKNAAQLTKVETFTDEVICCERFALDPNFTAPSDLGGGLPVLGVAAGKKIVFYGGPCADQLLKEFVMPWTVSSVAIDVKNRKVLAGQAGHPWAVILDWETGAEEQTIKSHHGPINSMAYSPDNKIFATGSEDGTLRLWKNCEEEYGLWKRV